MEHLETLIVDLKESLEREVATLRHEMNQGFDQMNSRFDTQAARLERHAGLWQTGARWSSRMEAKDHEIAELRERLQRLERRSA